MNKDDVIFMSASVPHRNGWTAGIDAFEIEEAIVSLARAVFARGGRLLFGGHPSVSPLVSAVAGEYFKANPHRPDAERPVVTFQSEWFREHLPDETSDLHRFGWTSIQWTPKEKDRRESLRTLRRRMLDSSAVAAMFAIGGMEGVVDEALMFLQKKPANSRAKPSKVYALPSGGGAAARLVNASQDWSVYSSEHGTMNRQDFAALDGARSGRALVDAERIWRDAHPSLDLEPRPLAAIVQWVLDTEVD